MRLQWKICLCKWGWTVWLTGQKESQERQENNASQEMNEDEIDVENDSFDKDKGKEKVIKIRKMFPKLEQDVLFLTKNI